VNRKNCIEGYGIRSLTIYLQATLKYKWCNKYCICWVLCL